VGYGVMDWIELTQDKDRWRELVTAVMYLWVPKNAGEFLTSSKPVSFSRGTVLHGTLRCQQSAHNVSSQLTMSAVSS
jgi:hypothetical protein